MVHGSSGRGGVGSGRSHGGSEVGGVCSSSSVLAILLALLLAVVSVVDDLPRVSLGMLSLVLHALVLIALGAAEVVGSAVLLELRGHILGTGHLVERGVY
ncbi:hypothetical protein PENTCL1PPCAC_12781 [Pristionchus entomophagus]|uniref:G protein-coupled receptor n=1 Tax=Pristionchus entomophagus TaxID=358040 RepID=A0AAV5TF01_9BILA|nr:hypothetical protein PENTCL1PPCAC_12781 [Pristionchus entomophagus]